MFPSFGVLDINYVGDERPIFKYLERSQSQQADQVDAVRRLRDDGVLFLLQRSARLEFLGHV